MKSLVGIRTESTSFLNNDQQENNQESKEKNQLLVVSYITEENTNRCWTFFSDILKCQDTAQNIVINYKLNKGKNTFIVGNEFSCYWVGVSKIHYKCVVSQNNYGIRKIGWIINLDIGFSIRKTYIIYPITNNNRTLIKLNLELIGSENHEHMDFEETKDYYYKLQYTIINKVIKVMEKSNEYHFINESFIVNKSKEICWNEIINLNNMSKVLYGEIGENFICKGNPEKIGTFWKCQIKDTNQSIFMVIKKISKPEKRNTWVYCIESFGTEIAIIKQEVQFNFIKINNKESQISILIIFKEKITAAYYDTKKEKLKEIASKIKQYINNVSIKDNFEFYKNKIL